MMFRNLLAPASLFVTAALMLGCSSDDKKTPTSGAGENCWPTDPSCNPSGPGSQCMAQADNGAIEPWTFRMAQLQISRPEILSREFLQATVVTKAIDLNRPACFLEGSGRFSWLMQFFPSTGTTRTGGAHVNPNPEQGYCYINNEVIGGFPVTPMDIDVAFGSEPDGSMTFNLINPIEPMNVPIYLKDDETESLILPLHQVLLTEGRISPDKNCIGSWMGDELFLDNNCKPDRNEGQLMQWHNGAKLTGYITVEESVAVHVPDLKQTLCVVLSGTDQQYRFEDPPGSREFKCVRDGTGRILASDKADWCQSTNAACAPPDADAFRLEGLFAGSAVPMRPDCP